MYFKQSLFINSSHFLSNGLFFTWILTQVINYKSFPDTNTGPMTSYAPLRTTVLVFICSLLSQCRFLWEKTYYRGFIWSTFAQRRMANFFLHWSSTGPVVGQVGGHVFQEFPTKTVKKVFCLTWNKSIKTGCGWNCSRQQKDDLKVKVFFSWNSVST